MTEFPSLITTVMEGLDNPQEQHQTQKQTLTLQPLLQLDKYLSSEGNCVQRTSQVQEFTGTATLNTF